MLEYIVFNQAGQQPSYVPTLNGNNVFTGMMVIKPAVDSSNIFQVQSTNGTQCFEIDTSHQWVKVGPDQPVGNLDPQVSLYVTRSVNGYHAVNVQNPNSGSLASCDIGCLNNFATVDNGLGYLDLGITSSTFSDPNYAVYGANSSYLWTADSDFYLGVGAVDGLDHDIHFFFGGTDSTSYIKATLDHTGNFDSVSLSSDGGTNKWALGGVTSGSGYTLNTTSYLNVTVAGVSYRLAVLN